MAKLNIFGGMVEAPEDMINEVKSTDFMRIIGAHYIGDWQLGKLPQEFQVRQNDLKLIHYLWLAKTHPNMRAARKSDGLVYFLLND